jgi:hypothetical protein
MKDARRIVLAAVSGLALAATAWAGNPPDMPKTRQDAATKEQSSNQLQSVTGKIASVEKESFTLSVATNQTTTPGQQFSPQASTAKTMTFLIDKNTTVDGTLKVDSNAEVTYRQNSGANLAVSVRVTP